MALAYVGVFQYLRLLLLGADGGPVRQALCHDSTVLHENAGYCRLCNLAGNQQHGNYFWCGDRFLLAGNSAINFRFGTSDFSAHVIFPHCTVWFFFTHQIGSFLGAWAGGRIYDYYGSYEPIWWSTVVLALAAALISYFRSMPNR